MTALPETEPSDQSNPFPNGCQVGQLVLQYGCTYAILAATSDGYLLGTATGRRIRRYSLKDFKPLEQNPIQTLEIFQKNALPPDIIDLYIKVNRATFAA